MRGGGGGSEIIFVPEDELRCNVRRPDWRCKNWRIHERKTCQFHYLKGVEKSEMAKQKRRKKKELSGQNFLDLVTVKADDEEDEEEEGGLKRNQGFMKGYREIVKQSEEELKVYSLTEKRSRRRNDFSGFVTVKSEKKEDESKSNKGFMEGDTEIVEQGEEKLKVYSLTGKRSRRRTDLSGFVAVKSEEEEDKEIVKQSGEKWNVYRRTDFSGFVTVKSEKEEDESKSNKGFMKGDREIVTLNTYSLPEKRSRKRKDFSGFVSDYVDEEEEDEKKCKIGLMEGNRKREKKNIECKVKIDVIEKRKMKKEVDNDIEKEYHPYRKNYSKMIEKKRSRYDEEEEEDQNENLNSVIKKMKMRGKGETHEIKGLGKKQKVECIDLEDSDARWREESKEKNCATGSATTTSRSTRRRPPPQSSSCSLERVSKDERRKMSVEIPKKNKGKEEELFLRCHQCIGMKCKGEIVCCKHCKAKRYCLACIRRWYPRHTADRLQSLAHFVVEAAIASHACVCAKCLRI